MEDKYHREIPAEAKLQAVLSVWSQAKIVTQICEELKISRQTFYDWENAMKLRMQETMEPQKKGRPPKDLKEQEEMLKEIRQLKAEILKTHDEVKSLGGTTISFCRVTGLGRAILYRWQERRKTGRLEDTKPVAKTIPNRLPETKKEELKYMLKNDEMGTDYVIAQKAGVSKGTVSNIRNEMVKKQDVVMPVIQKGYDWNMRNVCWSMDTFQIKLGGRWVYILLLIEEMSRILLGYRISFKKSGWYSREILLTATANMGIKPLVIKHDRGVEFMNKIFLSSVNLEGIITLASPGYYPLFNGRAERAVKLTKRILKRVLLNWNCGIIDLHACMTRVQYVINYELPRMIFNGKTSWDVYENGTDYEQWQRNDIISKFSYNQQEIYRQYFSGGKIFLDKHRKEVVEYLSQKNLCLMKYRIKSNIG